MESVQHHTLDNGLLLITESIKDVRTAAIEWVVPAGVATNEYDGDSVLLTELSYRGAGGLCAREHTKKLDLLGVRRDITCGVRLLKLHGLMLGSKVCESMAPIADMLLRPSLQSDDLYASQQLCLQALDSLQDNPPKLVNIALNQHHNPAPFNRSTYGERNNIESATIERLQAVHQNSFCPCGSIISIAGDIDHEEIFSAVQEQTFNWSGENKDPVESAPATRGVHHIKQETSQVHIGLAFDGPQAVDEHSILEMIAVSIFGGATSGRLFTEVRQKRSLCYSVNASYQRARDNSSFRIHAGTTPKRASETVEVILDQLEVLRDGVTPEELSRTITRLRANTVMRGESTAARASALLGDQYAIGKTRTLQDRLDEISSVSLESVNSYLKNRQYGAMTMVLLGPEELEIDENRMWEIS
ncbi:insulinase family protein [PVC group bacterium]|nr:insulinase family protein [PVC group bacterium]